MKKGFVFIETIIVVCILTVTLMSLYKNYSKVMTNMKEINTYDVAEYNYKTYFLKKTYLYWGNPAEFNYGSCKNVESYLKTNSDNYVETVCILDVRDNYFNYLHTILVYDPYIIDYLKSHKFNSDYIFLAKYKKLDRINSVNERLYLTYISSLEM